MNQVLLNKYSNKFVSRWLILAIDLMIVSLSFILANVLRHNFHINNISWQSIERQYLFMLYVRLGCFFYFRSYTGIIRHTSIEDAVLLFKTITLSTFVAGSFSLAIRYVSGYDTPYYVPLSILSIDYFICLFLLISSRFLVKSVYESLILEFKSPKSVLIYGAGYSGLITKNVLSNDKTKGYLILGFIDDNPAKVRKTIEGIRVYDREEATDKFLNKNNGDVEVIVAIKKINSSAKREISDFFLQKGIVVKTLPPVEKWVDGEFSVNQIHNLKIEDLLERDSIEMDNQMIGKVVDGKVVMITGAAGSIGSEIVRQLLNYFPAKIILVDQAESALYDLEFEIKKLIPDNTNVQIAIGDVADRTRMSRIFRSSRPHLVFHAAAYKHVPMMENNPYEAVKVNIIGTRIIAELSAEYDVAKFVMVSTDKAVNPTNVMGATKRVAEMFTQSMNYVNNINTKYIATRFGNVLGSNGSVIPLFKRQIEQGGPVTVTHPEITRYFMTIPEACQLVLEAGAMGKGGEVFVFDMGEPIKISDLAKKMITLSGLREGKDILIEYSGLRPGEKLYEELLNDNENTILTHHPKIMCARVITPSFGIMEVVLDELERLLYEGNNKELIGQIKNIVPEYVSNNSVYEELDKIKIRQKSE
jgi:FlaA1/EpsC-like NDP-sugar epimerase